MREYIEKAERKLEETDMLGNTSKYSYNDHGLLSQQIEGNRTTVYSYDTMNRLTKNEIYQSSTGVPPVSDSGRPAPGSSTGVPPVSSTTLLSYSSTDKLISISDESGKIEFAYDSFNRVTNKKGAVGAFLTACGTVARLITDSSDMPMKNMSY